MSPRLSDHIFILLTGSKNRLDCQSFSLDPFLISIIGNSKGRANYYPRQNSTIFDAVENITDPFFSRFLSEIVTESAQLMPNK